MRSYSGATYPLRLPAALTEQLRVLGRDEGATIYMTLLALFVTLLHRFSVLAC